MSNSETPIVKYCSFEDALRNSGFLLYTISGTSMLPFLRQKIDIVEIHPIDNHAKKYDVVLFKRGGKYILHRVLKVRLNDYVVCGDNNIRREYGITDGMILGVMTRVIRNGKSIYPTDWKYRLYVHLWYDFYPVRVAILYVKKLFCRAGHRLKKLLG